MAFDRVPAQKLLESKERRREGSERERIREYACKAYAMLFKKIIKKLTIKICHGHCG